MRFWIIIMLLFPTSIIVAQQNIGIGTLFPDSSAILQLESNNKGLLIPKLGLLNVYDTITIKKPAESLLIYNTTLNEHLISGYYYWGGNKWVRLMTDTFFDKESAICLNLVSPQFIPDDPLMPTNQELKEWCDLNLSESQKKNTALIKYFIPNNGGDCFVPDYVWSLDSEINYPTRIQQKILTVPDYNYLRNLDNYNHDIVNMSDFEINGQTYTGGVFRKAISGIDNGAYIIKSSNGDIWKRDFDPIQGYLATWWGIDTSGTVSNTFSLKMALEHIDSIGGGTLILPSGTINVTPMFDLGFGGISGIRILNNIVFKGQGSGTVINYVYDYLETSGTGIIVVGKDCKLHSFTIKSENFVIAKGIAIGVSTSADNCIIDGVICRNWGGYNIHLAGESSLPQNYCKNVVISNCIIYDVADSGIELSTAKNCVVSNCIINFKGRTGGGNAWGILFFAGAENNIISNVVMERMDNSVGIFAAIGFQSETTSNDNGYLTQNNRVTDVVATGVDIALDLKNGLQNQTHSPINIYISNSTFTGNGTGKALQISRCKDVEIHMCTFKNFSESDIDSPALVNNQRQSQNINISNCKFINTGEFNFYGVDGINIRNNYFVENNSTTGYIIKILGCTNSQIVGNKFKDCGNDFNTNCFFVTDNSGSDTNKSEHIVISNNFANDNRSTKWLFRIVILNEGSSNIKCSYNYINGKDGSSTFLDLSNGTGNINIIY